MMRLESGAVDVNFRSLLENAQNIVVRYDLNLRFLYVSPFVADFLDISSEKLIGKTLMEVGFSDKLARFFDRSIREVVTLQKPIEIEFTTKKRGIEFFLESRIFPEFDENGSIKSIVSITHDISSRKQAEAAFRKNQANLSALAENTDDIVWSVDSRYRLIIGNSAFHSVIKNAFGIEILPGESAVIKKLPRNVKEEWRGRYARALRGERFNIEIQTRFSSPDKYISFRFQPIKIDNKIVRVVVSGQNITERKRMAQALEQSEKRFRALIEHSADAISLIDANSQVIYESPSVISLTGYTSEERLGKSGFDLVHPDDIPIIKSTFARVTKGTGSIVNAQFRSVRKDKTVWWTEGTAHNLLDEPGVQAIVINYRDITQRKKAEMALKDANEQLNARLAQIEQLQSELRELALRDPLTSLFNRRYLSETLEREFKVGKREKKPVSVIVMDIDRFKRINDAYGHRVGDEFLTTISRLLESHSRGSDITCRYGGEEFLIVMPGANIKTARKRAEELRVCCEKMSILHDENELHITMSLGVATYPTHGKEAEEIVIKADKALYKSKRRGRNCVTVWSREMDGKYTQTGRVSMRRKKPGGKK
jgi:diguanylate cyclase (GGDEF)-like protein/PAS domain S-box-containing protein